MFALPVGRTPGWDYYLGAASMNLVYQDLSTDCCKSLPTFSIKIRFPVVNLYRFPYNLTDSLTGNTGLRTLKEVTHNAGEVGCSPCALFSHWRNLGSAGELLVWYYEWGNVISVQLLLLPF